MKKIGTNELRELYLQFFESKGHVRIPGAPLVPENDPSVLFTTAGMHPLVPYLKGAAHPAGRRLTNAQKCLRTKDIEAVGDSTHATVFEMLGNWSLGDYFKEEAISWSWEFLTGKKWLGIDTDYMAVSVFSGDDDAPRDMESAKGWQQLGMPERRIAFLGKEDNWWPAGGGAPGPQGPDTEMFFWTGPGKPPATFDPANTFWVEIWNDVFMQYDRSGGGQLSELRQKNVDTGMGLERVVMVLNALKSIYEIDSFQELMRLIHTASVNDDERSRRIVADHLKAAVFLLGDSNPVLPANTDQGYVLRRLIRRAVRSARLLGAADIPHVFVAAAGIVIDEFAGVYPSLMANRDLVERELAIEVKNFMATLDYGLKKIEEYLQNRSDLNGQQAFELFTTYGFPLEMQIEEATKRGTTVDTEGFMREMEKHRTLSRTAAAGKFKGGLADTSPQSVRYHTATHLLHQALRDVLGKHVLQRGSNITPERLRFDFSHPEKLTDVERERVAAIVNKKIQADLPVVRREMTVDEAKSAGALGVFEERYGDRVSVYSVGDYSREICGGPHVARTGEMGVFRIVKEESAGAGVRRIKAVLT
ncbi:MAG: alanine--tRNA ligase [Candidatus Andersenbacteria bacterium CG10_big_fil_rev_8_21_14_0_10_54_11]|uniref:Alanine--tRNA ligase n=1 Tax=Candidatus Andersenbacteria bacterium CG10_big_fil_rev_8_21_14_0_10_54_11 TaxID=1974485 RepID=A0A2M6WYF1_9BACT|nr:MAG: alanine--tRNA ligase [Candidatus Andersenbacteria bacterium CG10_big_fil_rev_8_21_14_0_10_54_11]